MRLFLNVFMLATLSLCCLTACTPAEEEGPVDELATGDDQVVTDDTATDNEPVQDTAGTPDEMTDDTVDTTPITDTDAPSAFCGNSTVETGETCDGGTMSCEALGSQYGFGNAPCKVDCSGYDTTNCPLKGNGTPYGTVNIAFVSDFLFDYDTADTQGDSYFNEHPEGYMTTAAFTGTMGYGTGAQVILEGNAGDTHDVTPYRFSDGEIYVVQHSMNGNALTAPRMLLIVTDAITTGQQLTMCPDAAVLEVIELNSDGSIKCLHAVALNETLPQLTVDLAENLTQTDGGKLHLSGSNIVIYHPTDTPDGNISQAFIDQGAVICPIVP